MVSEELFVRHTRKWITDIVMGCNFCPFAARAMKQDSIGYEVLMGANTVTALQAVLKAFVQLDEEPGLETFLIIIPDTFKDFKSYLDLVESAEQLLEHQGYEGIYQIASFHPEYIFAGSDAGDAANYTNRSPYPMLHFLREDSVSKAVDSHPDAAGIPARNIAFARNKGLAYLQALKEACSSES